MLNSALFNEIQYNGTRTSFPIYKLGSFSFNQWGYISKVLSAPYNLAVIIYQKIYQKIRVFITTPKFRTKQKFF